MNNNDLHSEYPENKGFAVCLIHEIDMIFPSFSDILHSSYGHIKKGSMKLGFKAIFSRFGRHFNPFFNFGEIIDIESRYGATSGFYFEVQLKGEKGYNYNISDLACELKNIRENGCEVGFLGSQNFCHDIADIVSRKHRLEDVLRDKVVGYLDTPLCSTTPETCEMLSFAGFEYIVSLVRPDSHPGRSLCYPFKANYHEKKNMDIIVLPSNIMDNFILGGFADNGRNNNGSEDQWRCIEQLIDQVSELSGVLVLRWPNPTIINEGLDLYERILSCCSKKNAWLTSGKEVAWWWGQRMLKE